MTAAHKNILFIMFDQLRFDYLSCAGHPALHTPNIDRLASKGVRFDRAYVQSPICGSSRMSFYTGRYVHSHGAQRNNFPLKVGEHTLGDHLRAMGADCYLIGKTHMQADAKGLERLGIAPDSVIGARQAECGFDVVLRDDGLWAEGNDGIYDTRRSPYNEYLKQRGYEADNPWHVYANAAATEDGEIASGWLMANADQPANVEEEDSETVWLTTRCIEFLDGQKDAAGPWLCHLSYIKPHWPYIVPAPYHQMYGSDDILPVNRDPGERDDPHPVYGAYMDSLVSKTFSRDEVREKVIPAYMGLIKQADDQLGRLFAHLEATGQMENTLIVVTSDHGDYLGDHWMGEKDLFHDCSVKIPLIVYDPDPAADTTRGSVSDALVEAIDLAPTFLEWFGGDVPDHILEGHSLLPLLRGEARDTERDFVISEYDYSTTGAAQTLGLEPRQCRLFMVADQNWKFVHAEGGFRPMLFDLANDPEELHDLGGKPGHEQIVDQMYERLGRWARRMSQRTVLSETDIKAMRGKAFGKGVFLGLYDGSEVPSDLLRKITGKAGRRP